MFQTINDFTVQAPPVADGSMLQLFVKLVRYTFDSQIWHGNLLMVPICNHNGALSRSIFSLFSVCLTLASPASVAGAGLAQARAVTDKIVRFNKAGLTATAAPK